MSSINEKIVRIMALALEISPADAPEDSGNPHVFVYYSAHCNLTEVRVWLDGWNSETDADYYEAIWGNSGEKAHAKADGIIAYLENLKEVQKNGSIV